MSILGELVGYDAGGRDIMGVNRDPQYNCVVCGRDCYSHSREQEAECLQKLYGVRAGSGTEGK